MARTPTATIRPLGDRALVIGLGDAIDSATSRRVLAVWRKLMDHRPAGVIDLVPAYTTLTVHYDWQALPDSARDRPWDWLADELRHRLADLPPSPDGAGRTVEIPVCYEPPHAPDLADVARLTSLTPDEIVARHTAADYRVAFLGFRPGFPYLLGLDPALAVPRLDTPRARVPAGSVGLAGGQTGAYPFDGPGGWRLIGATPLCLFDSRREPPALLAPGDRVRFVAIDGERFARLADAANHPEPPAATDGGTYTTAALDVLSPGICSSIQDAGRAGWRHLGVGASGAADPWAAALANALVGNRTDAAVLEMTIRGPELRLHAPVTIALVGHGMAASVDDQDIPFQRPLRLPAGCRLRFHATGHGARAWLAVAGGLNAPRRLGSAAIDFGSGAFGAPLAGGERLETGRSRAIPADADPRQIGIAPWWIDVGPTFDRPTILRFLPDADAGPALPAALAEHAWRVGNAADRTGTRLEGPSLPVDSANRRISAGVLHGSIQIPGDGRPILLGPDCQTVGGYPVAGHVIEADLPILAQLKPGDSLHLEPIDLDAAHAARRALSHSMSRLHLAIGYRHGVS